MDEHRTDYRQAIYTGYAENFQDAGKVFDRQTAARWGRAYNHYLRGWLPADRKAAIVELGCGGGRLLLHMLSLGYTNVRGVDISPDQVRLARQVTPNVEEADVLEWLGGATARFNLIVALDLIEHFRKDEVLRFLDLCFNAVKPGGRLVLQTPNADSPFGVQMRDGDFTHEVAFTSKLLGRLLARAGFTEVEVREQGPAPLGYSALSSTRWLIWQAIRAGLMLWNLAETGSTPSVLTRVFLVAGRRPKG